MAIKRIYGVECAVCNRRMFSFRVHDFKHCGCENQTMIDGGREYLRFGWLHKKPRLIYWCKKDGVYPTVEYKDTFPY